MKKLLILALILAGSSGCVVHMTAEKWMHTQLSYCPPTGIPYGSVGGSSHNGSNFSYSPPSHKRKTGVSQNVRNNRSYQVPRHTYKKGVMKHYKRELPKFKLKRI